MLDNYENERIVILEKILDKIEAIEDTATEVAIWSLIVSVLYMLKYCCISEVKTCIIDTGTSIPLFVLISTAGVEIKDKIMFTKSKRKKLQRQWIRIGKIESDTKRVAQMKQLYEDMKEWAENGREPEKMPKLPNDIDKVA